MISEEEAEKALRFLMETGNSVKPLCSQAKKKVHQVKWTEALLVKGMANQDVPVTLREKYARADQRYIDACNEDAEADGEWKGLQERRDNARITISLYQSQIKDRM